MVGLCACGCGRQTPLASRSLNDRDYVKGQPCRFLHGHYPGHPGPPKAVAAKKVCRLCDESLPLSEFYAHGSTFDRRDSRCKRCVASYNRDWRSRNRAAISAGRRSYKLYSKYGISDDDYQRLFDGQGGCCAICRSKEKLVVDHDHSSGRVRGLLCSKCNLGLGHLRDDADLLKSALEYLS